MKGAFIAARLLTAIVISATAGCAVSPEKKDAVSTAPLAEIDTANDYYARCSGQARNLGDVLAPIVSDMVAQRIPYTQNPSNEWRDCSGNFLRLSSYLASACPDNETYLAASPGIRDYRPGGDNAVPFEAPARSSRELARWYHEQGRFSPIYYDGVSSPADRPQGLDTIRNLIRPGAVLWFSLDRPLAANGLEGLFTKRVARGPHINHMGTVTEVTRDETGQLTSYAMYHGRSTGNPGSVTRAHYWTWPESYLAGGSKEYPSLGYWNQYLVGIGTIVPVVRAPGSD
jgi:hypothetical protein